MITETASAKINLYLHVGPVRPDGLHDLSSLFVFTELGDRISVRSGAELSLEISGPFGKALSKLTLEDNLVLKAASLLQNQFNVEDGAAMTLEKNLPIASGIGGGSTDAAAALRALIKLWRIDISAERLGQLAFSLGADVPACLERAPVIVSGAGELLAPGPVLPPLWVCLVNPGIEMPTGPIFKAFDAANPEPPAPSAPDFGGQSSAQSYDLTARAIAASRNDLEPLARERAPQIGAVIEFLVGVPDVIGARMSGSGATCFGLFSSQAGAEHAYTIAQSRGWWALASRLLVG